jgi:NADPH2:quinone reductase
MTPFKAFRIHEAGGKVEGRFDTISLDDLTAGEVVVRVRWSTINYKDALAATGAGKILRTYPLVGGIDLAGEVVSSQDARYSPGDRVVVTGCNLSETHDGGYAEFARVQADSVVPVPAGLDLADTMKIGTAGFTAALAVHLMERNAQQPAHGPVVVTGATGGVGSLAVDMLSARGYEVVAVSGKPDADDYLRSIGAAKVLRRQQIDFGRRPLEAAQWGGAIDNLGGDFLSWLTRTTRPYGNVAAIGLAASHEFHGTVMPFILRGVNLLGVNSVFTPRDLRLKVWERLATDLKPRHLDRICTRTIEFDALPAAFPDYVAGHVLGRTIVRIA